MDIRAKHSKEKIINTFWDLRAKKPIEKLTVVELCKKAEVNKSTFYAHFHDIYDLSDFVENQLVDEILSEVNIPQHNAFDEEFTINLYNAYYAHREKIWTLFSGSRSAYLPQKITKSISTFIFSHFPELRQDERFNIILMFSMYGGFYTSSENNNFSRDKIIAVVLELNKYLSELTKK